MSQFQIPEKFSIPFFDHKDNLGGTIKASAARRGMSPLQFAVRKIRNIFWYRMAFFCPINSWRVWMHRRRGVHIGEHCYIAQQVVIDNAYPEMVFIEDYAGINQGTTILTHTNVRELFAGVVECAVAPVVVRRYAVVSINSTLLPGVEVGEAAIVNAGSVVIKNVKPYSLVAGNPAKQIVGFEGIVRSNMDGAEVAKSGKNTSGGVFAAPESVK